METIRSVYACHLALVFAAPDGQPIPATLTQITLENLDDELTDCQLTIQLNEDAYADSLTGEYFHLWAGVANTALPDFDADQPIEIDLRLGLEWLSQFGSVISTPESAAEYLTEATSSGTFDVFVQTESWYALTVTQAQPVPASIATGTLKTGYRTLWQGEPIGAIFTTVVRYLRYQALPFERQDASTSLQFLALNTNGQWRVVVEAAEDAEECRVYSYFPEPISDERAAAVAEYLHRANYGLPLGNFEFDYASGQVRYKTSLNVANTAINIALIENVIYPNLLTMGNYFAGLQQVLAGQPPRPTIEALEADFF